MLKWYSSHPSRILICPIMHIMPIHISGIWEVSCFRKKQMTQKWDICAHFSTNDIRYIRYGWNLCWCKILNTDRWLIPLYFPICLLLACGFSAAKAPRKTPYCSDSATDLLIFQNPMWGICITIRTISEN